MVVFNPLIPTAPPLLRLWSLQLLLLHAVGLCLAHGISLLLNESEELSSSSDNNLILPLVLPLLAPTHQVHNLVLPLLAPTHQVSHRLFTPRFFLLDISSLQLHLPFAWMLHILHNPARALPLPGTLLTYQCLLFSMDMVIKSRGYHFSCHSILLF